MKTVFSLLFLFFFTLNLDAQLPDGSIAPNITFTDIDGNTHTLYDVLDEGKSVVFDVMATWCGPCWNYQNTGILEELYDEYGPNGTNEIEIFMVESSNSTNEACLYGSSGCSGGTYGNWTAGIFYPIVHITSSNGGSFNNDFNINYFPTLYKVCPNRKIYEVGQPPLSGWENWVTSCNLDATEEIANIICFDDGQTEIDLTIEGGYGNISYSWSNGSNTQDLIGIPDGEYSCTITEGQGHAIEIGPFTIDSPSSSLNVSIINQGNVACSENNDGFINTFTSGGGTNYTYQWNNGASTENLNNLSSGLYTLSVTDSYGCVETVSTFITEPPLLTLTTQPVNENCDNQDGSILLFANGGQGSYLYDIGQGQTPENIFTNLEAGTYFATVTDENSCTSVSVATIENEAPPTAEAEDSALISCNEETINLDGSGSSSGNNIIYSWQTLTGNIVSGENTLYPIVDQTGTYTLFVSNIETGCQSSVDVIVTGDLNAPESEAGEDAVLSCSTTSVTLDGSNSSQGNDIEYLWLNEDGEEISTQNNIDVDLPGTYELIVSNSTNGCSASSYVEVTEDIELPNAIIDTPDQITCATSSITVDGSPSSQGSQFQYLWLDENDVEIGNDITAEVSQIGNYQLIVTNTENGCSQNASIQVEQDIQEPIAEIENPQNLTCATTSITIDGSPSSQGSQFQYLWLDENDVEISNDITAEVSQIGNYQLIVTNTENGCSQNASIQVEQDIQEPIAEIENPQNITCTTSSITVDGSPSSQGSQFQYLWLDENDVEISNDITAEVSQIGNYQLIVTNTENGCSQNTSIQVEQDIQEPIAEIENPQNITCTTSSITVDGSPSSQGSQFQYLWLDENDEEISNDITGEVSQIGNYQLIVTNTENGCSQNASIQVEQDIQEPIAEIENPQNLTCATTSITIDGSPSSQGSQFQYLWLDENDEEISNDITAEVSQIGNYQLIVTDTENGCSQSTSIEVEQDIQEPIADAGENSQLDCDNASVELDASNSSIGPEFEYSWYTSNNVNIGNSISIEVSTAENYTLIVTNILTGCTASSEVTVEASTNFPDAIVDVSGVINCVNNSILVDGTGSSQGSNFEYQWVNSLNEVIGDELTININSPGTYALIITNQENGCFAQTPFEVQENFETPTAQASVNDILSCNLSSLMIDGSGSSSGSNISYTWTTQNGNILGNPTIQNPLINAPGVYNLSVLNTTNGCSSSTTIEVFGSSEPVLTLLNLNHVSCFDGDDGNIDLTINGGVAPYTYNWSNGTSSIEVDNLSAGTYTLTTTDAVGCEDQFTVTITQPAIIETSTIETNNICETDAQGAIDLSVIGGNGGYIYQWSNGMTTADINNLEDGTYTVLITDQNGCQQTETVNIFSEDLIAPTSLTQDIILNLDQNGNASITPDMIDNGSIDNCGIAFIEVDLENFDCSNLGQNEVSLIVTDNAGNTASQTAIVTIVDDQNPTISCIENIVSNSCQGVEYALPQAFDNCGTLAPVLVEGLVSGSVFPEGETTITYQVEDFSGNIATCSFIVTVENTLENTFDFENNSCYNAEDGSILAIPEGGTPGYTFTWNTGASTQEISNLTAGEYSVIITDQAGCQFEESITITEPDALVLIMDNINNEQENNMNGSVEVSISGGTPGYMYQWTDINGTLISEEEDLQNVPAGTYILTVIDTNGCILVSDSYIIDNIVAAVSIDFRKYISIAPNPTSGAVLVDITLDQAMLIDLSVLDVTGRKLLDWQPEQTSTKVYDLNLSDFPNGVYFVRIIIDGMSYVQKVALVKQ